MIFKKMQILIKSEVNKDISVRGIGYCITRKRKTALDTMFKGELLKMVIEP